MKHEIWLANGLVLLHTIVVGITVAGCVAIFTGRFARFHKKDIFAWTFIACAIGQIISLILTGGCVFTEWEKNIRHRVAPTTTYSQTFLQEYLPFLPEGLIQALPFLTLGGLIGAIIQIYFAIKRKRDLKKQE
jgi:Protein of Unknown function (DUF2784)